MATKLPSSKPSAPRAKSSAPVAKKVAAKPKATKSAKTSATAPSAPARRRTKAGFKGQTLAGPEDTKYLEVNSITKQAFLVVLSQVGVVSKTCEMLKMNSGMMYLERNTDPEFKKAWDRAVHDAFPVFEDEVRRRAFQGYDRPVYQQGMLVGHMREYSDKLAELMVKAGKPEIYNPVTRSSIEHAGTVGVLYASMSDDELNKRCNEAIRFLAQGKSPVVLGEELSAQDALHPAEEAEDEGSLDQGELKAGAA